MGSYDAAVRRETLSLSSATSNWRPDGGGCSWSYCTKIMSLPVTVIEPLSSVICVMMHHALTAGKLAVRVGGFFDLAISFFGEPFSQSSRDAAI